MICKFFSNKKGGGVASINYLLNERVADGTARVLRGDERLTRKIINKISNKQKNTVGVLSFEESYVSNSKKEELMTKFEETLFAGLDKDDYNILWVEHTDKGRVELNFVIPKINLRTKKALQPYYHGQDFPLLDKWQRLQNLEYGFTNPKDPAKSRSTRTNIKSLELVQEYKALDELLHNAVTRFEFSSRDELVAMLNESGYTVTRANDNSISIKLPNKQRAKKYKGVIYEQWNSVGELKEKFETTERDIRDYRQRDTQAELRELTREYNRYLQDKCNRNQSQHHTEAQQSDKGDRTAQVDDYRAMGNVLNNTISQLESVTLCSKSNQHQSTKSAGNDIDVDTQEQNALSRREHIHYRIRGENNILSRERALLHTSTGGIDDRDTEATRRSLIEFDSQKQELIADSELVRKRVQKQYQDNASRVDERVGEYTKSIQKRIREYNDTTKSIQSANAKRVTGATDTKREHIKAVTRTRDYASKYYERKLEIKRDRERKNRLQLREIKRY